MIEGIVIFIFGIGLIHIVNQLRNIEAKLGRIDSQLFDLQNRARIEDGLKR